MASTWFKTDNTLVEDPSLVGLSPFAWTLWLHAMSYCSRNLTDGHIPQAMLPRLSSVSAPDRAAAELVDAGLLCAVEDGWEIVGYLDEQQSRAEVEAERDSARERKRRSREKSRQVSRSGHGVTSPVDTDADADTSHHLSTGSTELVDNVTTRVVEQRFEAQRDVRNPAAWKRTALRNLTDTERAEIERVCEKWPDAPVAMLAAAVDGTVSPHPNNYRPKESA